MEAKPDLTDEKSWKALREYYELKGKCLIIKDLFASDPDRFKNFRYISLPLLAFNSKVDLHLSFTSAIRNSYRKGNAL